MKIKNLTAVFLALLMLSSLLMGCGASKMTADMGYAEAPMENGSYGYVTEEIYDSVTADKSEIDTGSVPQAATERKLIRRININAETENLDGLLAAVDGKVVALGGYIESREVYAGSRYSSYETSRRANLTVRIPKDKLDEFVSHVGNESNVTSSNETSNDVTLSYVATQSRMTALQKEEARLLELIDKAANLTELLELEKRLTDVRTELENVTSQLLMYDNLVDYGTVTLSISEVEILTPIQEPSFWTRMSDGFMNSLRNLWSLLKELAIFLVVSLPYLLPLAVIGLVVALIARQSFRKHRRDGQRKAEDQT